MLNIHTGPAGPTGTQGRQGNTGAPGPKGNQGSVGEKGAKGDVGPKGKQCGHAIKSDDEQALLLLFQKRFKTAKIKPFVTRYSINL